MFNENGVTMTPTNRVTISELTPATTYRFRVSAITEDEERGAEVPISVTTDEATGGRIKLKCLKYFIILFLYRETCLYPAEDFINRKLLLLAGQSWYCYFSM